MFLKAILSKFTKNIQQSPKKDCCIKIRSRQASAFAAKQASTIRPKTMRYTPKAAKL